MPEPTSTFIATGVAGKKLVESVISDCYSFAKSHGGFQLKKWKATRHADTVAKRIKQLRLVKTIWQIEREIDLLTFYCPPKMLVNGKRRPINQLADIGYDGNLVIEGTVGQGKSILLRYLAATDFNLSRRIPIFIELRKLRANQRIEDISLSELKALGFEMDPEVFDFFIKNGKIALFLDAFDEVKDELRQDLITNVEHLIRQYDKLQVIVTSRPESGISTSPLLRVYKLCQLEGSEHESVIKKMAHDKKTSDLIISGVKKEAYQVSRLLKTPLMVALLMIRFRIDQSIPQNSAAFYDSLFNLLLQRHDKSKGGYVRPRKSGASDLALNEFFNALSYLSRRDKEVSFPFTKLTDYAKSAARIVGVSQDVDKIVDDIVSITCLIIRDGEEARFIHKSVQEYHAAQFIKEQPDESAKRFYEGALIHWSSWDQELRFLRYIDTHRFNKFFNIPSLRSLFNMSDDSVSPPEFSEVEAIRIFGRDRVNLHDGSPNRTTVVAPSSSRYWQIYCSLGGSTYLNYLFEVGSSKSVSKVAGPPEPNQMEVEELLKTKETREHTLAGCRDMWDVLSSELRDAEAQVSRVEDSADLFDLKSINPEDMILF